MKYWVFFLTFFVAISIFFSYRQLTSVSTPVNDQPQSPYITQQMVENARREERKSRFERKDIYSQFSNTDKMFNDEETQTSLKFQDYIIKQVTVNKRYDADSPIAGIYDAVLTKKGKRIAKFEGAYHPLGNQMSFGLISLFGNDEKQLVIFDESLKYEHTWLVQFSPNYNLIFNSEDFGIWGGFGVIDIEKDGVFDLVFGKDASSSFNFTNNSRPYISIIFKYNAKSHKYLPATHLFPEFTLEFLDEDIEYFEKEGVGFSELLEVFLKYQYTGQEDKAWEFFDKYAPEKYEQVSKDEARKQLKEALQKDVIYKFVQNDLKKSK